MYSLFKGYVPTKNKKCLTTFKNKKKEDLLSKEEADKLEEYAGILNDNTILVDIDDSKQSEILMDIVEDLQLNCRVYQTTRGKHFLFKNDDLVNKCSTHSKLACGLEADIKIGSHNSYSVLKFKGKERFIEWDSESEYDTIPRWLLPVKSTTDFVNMQDGDGRNQALYNYILKLQTEAYSKDEIKNILRMMNKYVFKKPLSDGELDTIMRDDAFNKPVFFEKTTFLFDKFARYIMNNNNIIRINNQLHIFKDGIYVYGYKEIESIMIALIPNLKDAQRKEVLKYLDLIAPDKEMTDANYIAFNNGVYNIAYDTLESFNSDFVITNKIPWNYKKDSYNLLADNTLNKLACNDGDIRSLLEECIGYTFYRRNELGKAFILTGDKSNGKSTFLDVLLHILGEQNTSALDLKELGDRFSTAGMFGKLANIGDDIGDDFLQGNAVAMFKKLVTGNRIKAERKGQDPFEFNPYLKLLFSANDMPKMRDKTGAVLRRLVMIPFDARFSKNDADYDPYVKYKLIERESIEYLITVGVKGLRRVLENNEFTKSSKVESKLADYELENNPILGFIDSIDVDEINNEVTQNVYLRYNLYCCDNKFIPCSNISFSKQLCKYLNMTVVDKKIDGKKKRIFALL